MATGDMRMSVMESIESVYDAVAAQYKYRPSYPQALFTYLADITAEHRVAWDCGCGSGQASYDLAKHFDLVIATDPSEQQLRRASACTGVEFRCAPAEASGLPSRSVDLVSAFMAAHWFDLDAFYAEAKRVARPGATIAMFVYGEPKTGITQIDGHLARFSDLIHGYGGPSIQSMRNMYSDLYFPFGEEVNIPALCMEAELSLDGFLLYTRSRASVMDYMKRSDGNLVRDLQHVLEQHWLRNEALTVRWPLHGRVGKLA
jgi:SAM-dependent methyltransferase